MSDRSGERQASWRRREDEAGRAFSHVSVREIKRRLEISWFGGMLLWLSKTNYHVLVVCPTTVRTTLAALGMMVIFTTALAFVSALYTVKTALVPPDYFLAWPISVVLAAIYAFGIMIIDREIVGATGNRALFIRFVFALFIATAVSYPVKLLFFDGRIANEIAQLLEEEYAPKIERIEQLKDTAEAERRQRRDQLDAQIAQLDGVIAVVSREIEREEQKVHCGPKCQALIAQKAENMAERRGLVEEMDSLPAPGQLPEAAQREVDLLRAEMDARAAVAYDFLYKMEALDRIAREVGPSYYVISTFLFIFFLMLEIVPLALKFSIGRTEYHYYIDARTRINNQKIVSIANLYIERMERDNQAALEDVPAEVTDVIAAAMEDEAIAERSPETRSVAEVLEASAGDTGTGRTERRTPPETPPSRGGGEGNA